MVHDCDDGPLNIPGERRIRLRLRGVCDHHPEEGDVVYFGDVERVAPADDRAMAAAMTRVTEKIRALIDEPGAVGGAVYADQLPVDFVMTREHGTDDGLILWRVPFKRVPGVSA